MLKANMSFNIEVYAETILKYEFSNFYRNYNIWTDNLRILN